MHLCTAAFHSHEWLRAVRVPRSRVGRSCVLFGETYATSKNRLHRRLSRTARDLRGLHVLNTEASGSKKHSPPWRRDFSAACVGADSLSHGRENHFVFWASAETWFLNLRRGGPASQCVTAKKNAVCIIVVSWPRTRQGGWVRKSKLNQGRAFGQYRSGAQVCGWFPISSINFLFRK